MEDSANHVRLQSFPSCLAASKEAALVIAADPNAIAGLILKHLRLNEHTELEHVVACMLHADGAVQSHVAAAMHADHGFHPLGRALSASCPSAVLHALHIYLDPHETEESDVFLAPDSSRRARCPNTDPQQRITSLFTDHERKVQEALLAPLLLLSPHNSHTPLACSALQTLRRLCLSSSRLQVKKIAKWTNLFLALRRAGNAAFRNEEHQASTSCPAKAHTPSTLSHSLSSPASPSGKRALHHNAHHTLSSQSCSALVAVFDILRAITMAGFVKYLLIADVLDDLYHWTTALLHSQNAAGPLEECLTLISSIVNDDHGSTDVRLGDREVCQWLELLETALMHVSSGRPHTRLKGLLRLVHLDFLALQESTQRDSEDERHERVDFEEGCGYFM